MSQYKFIFAVFGLSIATLPAFGQYVQSRVSETGAPYTHVSQESSVHGAPGQSLPGLRAPVQGGQSPTKRDQAQVKREQPPGPSAPAPATVSSACAGGYSIMQNQCDSYLQSPGNGGSSNKSSPEINSTSGGIDQINEKVAAEVKNSAMQARACRRAAKICAHNCNNSAEASKNNACRKAEDAAEEKHRKFAEAAREDTKKYKDVNDRIHQKPREGGPGDAVVDHGEKKAPHSTGRPPHPHHHSHLHPQSTAPLSALAEKPVEKPAEKPVEKTPEQVKQDRREQKRLERREERIDAMGKAFMSLNQKQNQAMVETPVTPGATQSAVAAAKVAAAAGPIVAGEKADKPEENNDEEIGRAGFNVLAKKNLDARKALAATMGIRSGNLPGASAIRPEAPGAMGGGSAYGGGTGGSGGVGGGFQHSGDGATLDPVIHVERPSDLPQNFTLGAPSAGGGGGGGGDNNGGTSVAGLMPTKRPIKNREPSSDNEEIEPEAATAVQTPQQIRAQNADIWNVISTSFRKKCAEGRLMDCAGHLPRQ